MLSPQTCNFKPLQSMNHLISPKSNNSHCFALLFHDSWIWTATLCYEVEGCHMTRGKALHCVNVISVKDLLVAWHPEWSRTLCTMDNISDNILWMALSWLPLLLQKTVVAELFPFNRVCLRKNSKRDWIVSAGYIITL